MSRADGSEDRYVPHRILGEGGSGRVWLVEDRLRPGTFFARKELAGASASDPGHEALRREFAALASLRHPSLVEVHEFGVSRESGSPFFTLELVEGRSIVEAVAREGPATFLELAVEALRALAFLHDCDWLHLDLKPANVLVRDVARLGCRVVLLDFGLSRPAKGAAMGGGHARGTLPYIAPELFRNEEPGRRADLYSLGALLHEAIHGTPPFVPTGSDLGEFVRSVQDGRRPARIPPAGFPDGVTEWLSLMLAANPADRPSSAVEALARLNDACGTRFEHETNASRAARIASGFPSERRAAIEDIERVIAEPRPRIVWLCGGPGAGKTRILRWLEAQCVGKGWSVHRLGADASPEFERLRDTAATRPTLILVDESETVFGGLVDFLERIARDPGSPPVRVLCAMRPGEIRHPGLRRLLDDTGTVPSLVRVDLAPLDASGIRMMAARATGAAPSDERVRWLARASEGIPSAVESLLIRGDWDRGGAPGASDADRPARLDLLRPETVRWLEALAVLRGEASEATIARVAATSEEVSSAAARESTAAGVVVRGDGGLRLASRALAAALLTRMDPSRKVALARAAAMALDDAGSERDPWRRSLLWLDAGEPGRALPLAERAAEDAEASGDPGEAAARTAFALRMTPREKTLRHRLRSRQGAALLQAGLHVAAVRAFGAAARLATEPAARAEALASQALALVHAGRFDRALAVAEAAARLANAIGSDARLAQARKAAAIALARIGREAEALPLLEAARGLIEGAPEEAEIVQIAAACKLRLRRDDAEADFRRALRLHEASETSAPSSPASERLRRGQALKARVGLAVVESRRGNRAEAASILERVRDEARALGSLPLQEVALSRLSAIATEEHRLDRAILLGEQAADLALYLGDRNLSLASRCRLADAQIRSGRPGDAVALLHRTLAGPLSEVEPENVDYARMLLANAELAAGSPDEERVRSLLAEACRRCAERGKPRAWLMALALEMERRARPSSGDPFEPVSERFDRVAADAMEPVEDEIVLRAIVARAVFHAARGDAESALARADEALDLARRHGDASVEARASALRAEALDALARGADAAAAIDEGKAALARAASRIEAADVRRDFLARREFVALEREETADSRRQHQRLRAMYDMIRALNSQADPDALLESILDLALRVVGAERGMVLLLGDPGSGGDPDDLSIRVVRNLEPETVRDAESYSRSVARAGSGRAFLSFDAGSDERIRELASVSRFGIRSLMCVPLRSRGTTLGTVYLDSRSGATLFTPDDLRFLEAFADHAALALENARARARLERQNRRLQAAAETRTEFASLVGRAAGMQRVFDLIERFAATDLPVLVRGESGTGKELVARAIHFHGPRKRRMFLSENCAAIPESLLESELFGHVRGAFTGADRERAGLFEQADGGTLFLDEVGDMSPAMQARLLRVLEEGTLRRVGGESTIRVDVRVITATHRDLEAAAKTGAFREDLLYRLRVLAIEIPPLRKRPGDVDLLVSHFLARIARERGRDVPQVHDELIALFERHPWPGNVRELQNVLQRLVLLAGRRALSVELLDSDPDLVRSFGRAAAAPQDSLTLHAGEKEQIRKAIAAARGNRRKAAEILGVSRATLYRKLREHQLP
jgi:transcriptional regulator with GAF, ATPase, and Fis domain